MKRKHVLVLVVINIVLRIPRAPGIVGDDGFVVLWMGLALSQGHWEIWATSPLSFLGLHPYAPGAIGLPFVIAVMIRLGLSYDVIVIILSMAAGIIGTIGAYNLGTELFRTQYDSFLFALFYSCSHIFIRFTHFTITQRGPFLAILPWFLLYCVKFIRCKNSGFWTLTKDGVKHSSLRRRRYAAYSAVLFLMLLLSHGLAIFLVLYAAVVIGYYVLRRLKSIIGPKLITGKIGEGHDYKKRMLIEEKTMSQHMLEEIQATMAWLKVLPDLITEMNDALLMKVREELAAAYKLYNEAFGADTVKSSRVNSESKLKMVFLEDISSVISQVDFEIEARVSDGHPMSVEENTRKSSLPELDRPVHDGVDGKHSIHETRRSGIMDMLKILSSDVVSWAIFLLLMSGAYYVGTRLLPVQAAKTAPFLGLSNTSVIGLSINLVVDYGIRLGLWSVFLPIGVLGAFYRDRGSDRKLLHCVLVPGVLFVLPISTYTSVLFLPVFVYYSVIGFDVIRDSISTRWIGVFSLTFVLAFSMTYQMLVVFIPFWILVLISLVLLFSFATVIDWIRRWYSYHTLIGKNLRRWRSIVSRQLKGPVDRPSMVIFVCSVIIISLVTTEGVLLQSENVHLSNDEMRFINFLKTQSTTGITFVPTPVIGRRLEAYGFPAVLSYNDGAALYFGWTDFSNVTSSCYLSPWNFLTLGTFYVAKQPTPEKEIFGSLFNANLTNPVEYEAAKAVGLEFVIVEKNADGYSSIFHSVYGETFSILLHSAPLACELVIDGQKMSLFRLL